MAPGWNVEGEGIAREDATLPASAAAAVVIVCIGIALKLMVSMRVSLQQVSRDINSSPHTMN